MTAQEALNSLVKESCPKRTSCDECKINYRCNCTAKGYIDVLQKLVDCSTPNKPVLYDLYNENDNDYVFDAKGNLYDSFTCCPTCKKQKIYDSEYDERFKYCSNCGQRILWSEENENTL